MKEAVSNFGAAFLMCDVRIFDVGMSSESPFLSHTSSSANVRLCHKFSLIYKHL